MLTAISTILAPLLVAGWALRRLRHRRLLLRELRGKYLTTLEGCEALSRQLDDLEDAARVAAQVVLAPGAQPFNAPLDLLNLREDVRNADESLLQAEGEWEHQHLDRMYGRLSALWAQLDSTAAGIGMFRQRVTDTAASVSAQAAEAAIAEHHEKEREARAGQEDEIRARLEREVPRQLARAGTRVAAGGEWARERLAAAEREWQEAREALGAADLPKADRLGRRARGHAMRLSRQLELGLVQEPLPPGNLAATFRAAAHEALLPVVPAIGWTLAAMAFASFMAFQTVGRLTGSTEKVLTMSGNLALGKPTRASHALDVAHGGHNAVDGDLGTAWASGASLAEAQGLVIDLKAKQTVGKVMILPQAAPAGLCRWEVDVSEDSWTWTRLGKGAARGGPSQDKSEWGTTDLPDGTVTRWLRVRPVSWGRSGVAVFEIRAFAPTRLLKK